MHFPLLIALAATQFTDAIPTNQKPLLQNRLPDVQAVHKAFIKAEIIPTVIDDFLPSLTLSISWSKKQSAQLGNTLKPSKLQDTPTITLLDDASPGHQKNHIHHNMTYIVTLTDPDAPSRSNPRWSEMCHWIATNVSLSLFTELPSSASTPDDIMPYKPPGPPPKTGKHRYVFLVFTAKNGTTEVLTPSKPEERQHWGTGKERGGVREWAEGNGLVAVGGNFVYAKNRKQ